MSTVMKTYLGILTVLMMKVHSLHWVHTAPSAKQNKQKFIFDFILYMRTCYLRNFIHFWVTSQHFLKDAVKSFLQHLVLRKCPLSVSSAIHAQLQYGFLGQPITEWPTTFTRTHAHTHTYRAYTQTPIHKAQSLMKNKKTKQNKTCL